MSCSSLLGAVVLVVGDRVMELRLASNHMVEDDLKLLTLLPFLPSAGMSHAYPTEEPEPLMSQCASTERDLVKEEYRRGPGTAKQTLAGMVYL